MIVKIIKLDEFSIPINGRRFARFLSSLEEIYKIFERIPASSGNLRYMESTTLIIVIFKITQILDNSRNIKFYFFSQTLFF